MLKGGQHGALNTRSGFTTTDALFCPASGASPGGDTCRPPFSPLLSPLSLSPPHPPTSYPHRNKTNK